MSTPARFSFALVSFVFIAAAIVGCAKKEDEPVVLTAPSAAVTPVKAMQDPVPPPQPAAGGSAMADPGTAIAPPPVEAPKAAPPQPIDGCCSALAALAKDAKTDAVTKSKANAAASMCNATAPLVKSGKGSRTTALVQIRGTMGGSAPAACN